MHSAVQVGADMVGFVSQMPSGPGVLSEDRIAAIAARVPANIQSVLLTSKTDAASIIMQQRRCGVKALQLCDALASAEYVKLRDCLPDIALIQVIHVQGAHSVAEAEACASFVDAILLDSGAPQLPVKELGGTGRTHDWEISAAICRGVQVPVYLAGGLSPENVVTAIRKVQPAGVDVCSGVRSGCKLNAVKLRAFVGNVRTYITDKSN